MSYFVKEADGNFHYSYYGVVDWVMAGPAENFV